MSVTRMLIALGLTLAAARAELIVIDPGGAPGGPLLQQAIAAAAPGDVLLLAPGDYEHVDFGYFIDKGITLLPASGAARITLAPVVIQNLPAGQSVVLRGFDVHASEGPGAALVISDTRGTVWIEDCQVIGSPGVSQLPSLPGGQAVIVFQAHAIFRHCGFAGGDGVAAASGFEASPGGDALTTSFSSLALYDCTLSGGDFGSGWCLSSGSAGRALVAFKSNVTVSGCTLTGGKEAADNDAQPGTSGAAILTVNRASVQVLQSVLLPGAVQGVGTQAPAVEGEDWTVELLAEPARTLVLPSLAPADQVVTMFLDGEPGDVALLLLSTEAAAWPVPRMEGTLALQPGPFGAPIFVGVLPGPEGQLSMPFSMGIAPGVEAMTVFAQGLFQDADGGSLGGASAITWIAAGP